MSIKNSGRGTRGAIAGRGGVTKGAAAPVWTTQSPPAATASAYTYTFIATDDSGDAPTYSIASGAIPTGFSLNTTTGVMSGTATVSGTYTFVLRATDFNGRYTDSNSLSVTVTLAQPAGGVLYQTPGTYTWTAPASITSVHVVAIGGGGAGSLGNTGNGAAGGGLGWKNNITVVPGTGYTVVVGAGGASIPYSSGYQWGASGGASYFINTSTVYGAGGAGGGNSPDSGNGYYSYSAAVGGGYAGDGGGTGGNGGFESVNVAGTGGGGAGGYSGAGGAGGGQSNLPGAAGNGGGGGGGGAGGGGSSWQGAGGGGTGVYGAGSAGAGGTGGNSYGNQGIGGGGGSGGTAGQSSPVTAYYPAGNGGIYGGGGGGTNDGSSAPNASGAGAKGAVRIIWGGTSRAFPSTNVTQNYSDPSSGGNAETII